MRKRHETPRCTLVQLHNLASHKECATPELHCLCAVPGAAAGAASKTNFVRQLTPACPVQRFVTSTFLDLYELQVAMAGTPRDTPASLLCSPNPARGGEAGFTQRQPSWGGAGTPVTPGSRFLQPLQTPRSDGTAARYKNVPSPTECHGVPPLPMASALFAVRAATCCGALYDARDS